MPMNEVKEFDTADPIVTIVAHIHRPYQKHIQVHVNSLYRRFGPDCLWIDVYIFSVPELGMCSCNPHGVLRARQPVIVCYYRLLLTYNTTVHQNDFLC
jgi:hypothetical protein